MDFSNTSSIGYGKIYFKPKPYGDKLDEYIQSHAFNQKVTVIAPFISDDSNDSSGSHKDGKGKKPKGSLLSSVNSNQLLVEEQLNKYFGYSIKKSKDDKESEPIASTPSILVSVELNLSILLNYQFITTYIKTKKIIALSQQTGIDCGNVFAITPTGTIIINIDKESYEQLGLVGTPSKFKSNHRSKIINRYIITNAAEKLSQTQCDRMEWCFKDRFGKIPILALVTPDCLKYLQEKCPKDAAIKTVQMVKESRVGEYGIPLAIDMQTCISNNPNDKEEQSEYIMRINEVLGMITCDIKSTQQVSVIDHNGESKLVDQELLYISCKSPIKQKQIAVSSIKGMISHNTISQLVQECKSMVDSKRCYWVAIQVTGFQDSPISWNLHEHGYSCNGDNDYTLIIRPSSDQCYTMSILGPLDNYC